MVIVVMMASGSCIFIQWTYQAHQMVFMLPHGDHVQDMGDLRGHKIKLLGPVSNASEDRFWHVVAQTSQTGMENGFPSILKKATEE